MFGEKLAISADGLLMDTAETFQKLQSSVFHKHVLFYLNILNYTLM